MSPGRSRVVLAYPLADPAAAAHLAERAEVVVAAPGEWPAVAAGADGLIVRPPAGVDAATLDSAPTLRVVATIGTGTDHIDLAAAAARGVAVVSAPGLNAPAVAEYVVAMLITAARRLDLAAAYLRRPDPDWGARLALLRGDEIAGTTIGLIGFGAVGRAVARRVRDGLGMRVARYDPYVAAGSPGPVEADVVCDSLPELLAISRVASVHVPLTEETRGMIGASELAALPPGAIVINTSRGGVVVEDDLVAALRSGQVASAVVDVFDGEPPSADRLRHLAGAPNLIVTPHIAGITRQSGSALAWAAVRGILTHLEPAHPTDG